jgi:hypothetical protein
LLSLISKPPGLFNVASGLCQAAARHLLFWPPPTEGAGWRRFDAYPADAEEATITVTSVRMTARTVIEKSRSEITLSSGVGFAAILSMWADKAWNS